MNQTYNISPILFGNGDELIYVSHLAFKPAFGNLKKNMFLYFAFIFLSFSLFKNL